MHRPAQTTLFLTGTLLVLIGAAGAGVGALQPAPPNAVACVDVVRLFATIEEARDVEAAVNQRAREFQQQREARERDVQALRDDLELLAPNSAAYRRREADLRRATIELEARTAWKERTLARMQMHHVVRMHRRAQQTIARVAKERGYDLVLHVDEQLTSDAPSLELTHAEMAARMPLHHAPTVDITGYVADAMDAEFRARSR